LRTPGARDEVLGLGVTSTCDFADETCESFDLPLRVAGQELTIKTKSSPP
jgi:hypothetical protein